MTLSTFPLRTERLSLRPHQSEDAAALQRIYAIPEVARFLLDEPWTSEMAAEKVAERIPKVDIDGPAGAIMLVIERDGVAIGDVQLWLTDVERRVAEIGWVLDPAFGGQGFAAEAVRAVLELAFAHYRLHRVTAQMDARNLASAKLADAVGMRREAHFREDWWSKGEWTDTLVFGSLGSDRS
ncbi:MAG: GNAT family N-acetyltransferase [Leucobacter sp.]|nr:GNAT family N-acetyltransferase [Leucobacter sp.]